MAKEIRIFDDGEYYTCVIPKTNKISEVLKELQKIGYEVKVDNTIKLEPAKFNFVQIKSDSNIKKSLNDLSDEYFEDAPLEEIKRMVLFLGKFNAFQTRKILNACAYETLEDFVDNTDDANIRGAAKLLAKKA